MEGEGAAASFGPAGGGFTVCDSGFCSAPMSGGFSSFEGGGNYFTPSFPMTSGNNFFTPSGGSMDVPALNYSSPSFSAPVETAAFTQPVVATPEVAAVTPVTPTTPEVQPAGQPVKDASLNLPENTPRIDPNDASAHPAVHVVSDASQIPQGQQPAVVVDANGQTREAANLKGDEKDIYVLVNGNSQQATEAANAAATRLAEMTSGKATLDDPGNLIRQDVRDKFGKGVRDSDENGGDGSDGGNDGNDGNGGGGGGGGGNDKNPDNDKDGGDKDGGEDGNNNGGDHNADGKRAALEAAKRMAHSVVSDHSLSPGVPGRFMNAHLGSPLAALLARMHKPPTPEELAELQKELEAQAAQLGKEGADATKNGDTATGDALTQMGTMFGDKAKLSPSSPEFQQFASTLQDFHKGQSDGTLTQAQVSALMPAQLQESIATAEVMTQAKAQNIDLSKPSDTPAYQDAIKRLMASLQLSDVNRK